MHCLSVRVHGLSDIYSDIFKELFEPLDCLPEFLLCVNIDIYIYIPGRTSCCKCSKCFYVYQISAKWDISSYAMHANTRKYYSIGQTR